MMEGSRVKFLGRVKARPLGALGTFALLAGGLWIATPGVSGASGGNTLLVSTTGTDHGSCKVHACRTIGFAVSVADNGSTIDVAAGTYPEQLVIENRILTIKGTGTVTLEPSSVPASDTNTDTGFPEYAVVDVIGGDVNLKGLTINGSGASSQFTSCGPDYTGVYWHNAIGTMSRDTVENIYLPVSPNNLFGCQDGNDVLVRSDAGQNANVTVEDGTQLKTYQKNGIYCLDAGTSCTVEDTTITGVGPNQNQAGNGFSAVDVASVTATGNAISDNSYAGAGGAGNESEAMYFGDIGSLNVSNNVVSQSDIGIYLTDDGNGPTPGTWAVSGNTVSDATDNIAGGEVDYGDGIQVDSSSNPITLSGNIITGSAENGISLLSASNVTVNGNQGSTNSDNGIYVGAPGTASSSASSGNTVSGNTLKKNGNDGILADTGSNGNTFTSNAGKKNVGFDFQDLGTGNTWTTNSCTPAHDSAPAGLC
jgi:parallel beta-helix repeat protein